MPQTYLENSLYYNSIGASQAFCGSYLRKIIYGYCEEDTKSQLFFGPKSIKIDPSLYYETVVAMCEGLDKLELLESGRENVKLENSKY